MKIGKMIWLNLNIVKRIINHVKNVRTTFLTTGRTCQIFFLWVCRHTEICLPIYDDFLQPPYTFNLKIDGRNPVICLSGTKSPSLLYFFIFVSDAYFRISKVKLRLDLLCKVGKGVKIGLPPYLVLDKQNRGITPIDVSK